MQPYSRRPRSYQAGFTLVELMVGLTIGMFAALIIVQVISVFEAQRRSTTGTADAQTNGGIALYTIAHELQMAGYPLVPVNNSPLFCTGLTINGTADATTPNRLSPVVITNVVGTGANASASDAITIRYGDSLMGGTAAQITAGLAGTVVPVSSNFGCVVNDISLIYNGLNCSMSKVNAVTGTPPAATTVQLADVTGAAVNSNLACVGTWHEVTYRVNAGNLERCDLAIAAPAGGNCNPSLFPSTPNPYFVTSVVGIVNLQAQYGVTAAANSTPPHPHQCHPMGGCQRRHMGRAYGRQSQPDQSRSHRGRGAERKNGTVRRDVGMQFHHCSATYRSVRMGRHLRPSDTPCRTVRRVSRADDRPEREQFAMAAIPLPGV